MVESPTPCDILAGYCFNWARFVRGSTVVLPSHKPNDISPVKVCMYCLLSVNCSSSCWRFLSQQSWPTNICDINRVLEYRLFRQGLRQLNIQSVIEGKPSVSTVSACNFSWPNTTYFHCAVKPLQKVPESDTLSRIAEGCGWAKKR